VQPHWEIVFCHNDLLAANILEDPATGELKLIDFEYGGANYRSLASVERERESVERACAATLNHAEYALCVASVSPAETPGKRT
jgi:hypothetical protein